MLNESLQSAYRTVLLNKMRTVLSLIGITIGIFAIIAVFTVLDAMENNIRESFSAMGDDIIYVEKWPWMPEDGQEYRWWEYLNRPVPRMSEQQLLKRRLESARSVVFFSSINSTIEFGNASAENVTVWGSTEEFEEMRNFGISRGRFLSPFEFHSGRNAAVIGDEIMKKLFAGMDPIGKNIKINGLNLTVVGVFEKEGNSFVAGGGSDRVVMVPVDFLARFVDLRDDRANPAIWVRASGQIPVTQFREEVRGTMRAIRRLKPMDKDNFSLNQSSILESASKSIFGIINFAGGFIGILAVIVGAFGIANIMFVSVKERTHIIGIQKALGAKKYYIVLEVLYESVLLSMAGGIVGLILVFAGTMILRFSSEFEIYLNTGNIILGIVISTVVGIIAGLFPAMMAARLDPVKAMSSTF